MKIDNYRFITPLWLYRHSSAFLLLDKEFLPPVGDYPLYVVGADYTVSFHATGPMEGSDQMVTVPKGLLTDGPSIPRAARSIVPWDGPILEPSIVHDWMYGNPETGSREFADKVFLAGMAAAGVPRFRRWLIYRAVRAFGQKAFEQGENQIVDLPD